MATHGTSTRERREDLGYFANMRRAAWSILEGMAVTFSYLRRPPITVQYPDRIPRPVTETIAPDASGGCSRWTCSAARAARPASGPAPST